MKLSDKALKRWDQRLENWAIFMKGDGLGLDVKISSAYSLKANGPPAEGDGVPGLLGDAMDTHALVCKLDVRQQQALVMRYCTALEDAEAARDLAMHRVTFVNLITYAKEELERLHNARFHGEPIKSAPLRLQQA